MKINKMIKTTGQAIDYLNESVLGKDPENPVITREYDGVKPLQDRIGDIELVDRDITDRLDVIENLDRDISAQLALKANQTQVNLIAGTVSTLGNDVANMSLGKADKAELIPLATKTELVNGLADKVDVSNKDSIIGVTSQSDVVNGNTTPKLVSGKTIKDYADTKATAAEVNNALADKADTSTVNAALVLKVDALNKSTILGVVNATKITNSDPNPELISGKVVKDAIDPKANKTYVDSQLALKQNVISDSGWLELSLINGWTTDTTEKLSIRKIGKIVYMRGIINGTARTGPGVATIPEGYRVPINTSLFCFIGGNEDTNMTIRPVAVRSYNTLAVFSNSANTKINTHYFVE